MLFGLLSELLLESFDVVFDLSPLLIVNLVDVGRARVADSLVEHPRSVQSHHTFLQLLVGDFVLEQLLLNVVLEVLDDTILPLDLALHLIGCLRQTFLSHPQVVHDKNQVLIDPIEVLLLRAHFICLFVELLDLNLLRTDVSFQLFDFVIENELELLQLLDFLLELLNLNILLVDGRDSSPELLLTRVDILLYFLLLHQSVLELILFFL